MTTENPYPERTLAHDLWRLGMTARAALAAVGDAILGGPPPALDEAARLSVSHRPAERALSVRPSPRSVETPQLPYAERVWLMAPATPWTLDLIRAAWTDEEAIEGARRALLDEVDPEAIADALLAYLDEQARHRATVVDAAVEAMVVDVDEDDDPRVARCGSDVVRGASWTCDPARCDRPLSCPLDDRSWAGEFVARAIETVEPTGDVL